MGIGGVDATTSSPAKSGDLTESQYWTTRRVTWVPTMQSPHPTVYVPGL